ncbi:MAG: copper amine oxidase N-terminal domain-containing protein [Caldisericia bacterium]|nr:copper amine oxidase N-terminal domain-containing protein [Caldisericia bacterium]
MKIFAKLLIAFLVANVLFCPTNTNVFAEELTTNIIIENEIKGKNNWYLQTPTVTFVCSNKSAVIYYYFNDKKEEPHHIYIGEPIDIEKDHRDGDLGLGKYTVSITYYAKIGDKKEEPKTCEIKVNTMNPEIVLEKPAELSFTTIDPTVTIDGRVTLILVMEKGNWVFKYDATVSINSENIPVNPDNGSFKNEYNLKPGHNSIKVIAEDLSGRTMEISISVFYETYISTYVLLFKYDSQEIYINDDQLPNSEDTSFVITDGRTMIPMDFFTEYFPSEVYSSNENGKFILTYKDTSIEFCESNTEAIVNGDEAHTISPPFYRGNELYIPLRFMFETFGGEVSWRSTFRDIYVEISM